MKNRDDLIAEELAATAEPISHEKLRWLLLIGAKPTRWAMRCDRTYCHKMVAFEVQDLVGYVRPASMRFFCSEHAEQALKEQLAKKISSL